nr:unnamed protein product [Callosobruchus chinensis]
MNRLEGQRQAVSQAFENQDQHISAIEKHVEEQLQQVKDHVKEIVREKLRELGGGKRSLTSTAPAFLDKHSGVVAKAYPYNGKTSWDVYYLQFENIARMNNWLDEKKACAPTSVLRDSAAAILENLSLSDIRDYSKITSALKLRFGDAHLTELLHGQLHNRTQQAKEDLTTFAYEVQSLAKRAFRYEDAQKGVFGISVQQDDDVNLRQSLAQLERERKFNDTSGGCDQAAQLRSENAKLKDTIMELEGENSRLRKELGNSFRDAKKMLNCGAGTINADHMSDHTALNWNIRVKYTKCPQRVVTFRGFSKFDKDAFNIDSFNVSWLDIAYIHGIEEKITFLTEKTTALFDRAPRAPWINSKVRKAFQKRDRALAKFERSNTRKNWNECNVARNEALSLIRKEKSSYIQSLFDRNNTTQFYKTLKSLKIQNSRAT